MKKYLAFFRLRFSMGLQYRAAALAGVVTQFFWGMMEILMFRAFYEASPESFPMTFQAAVSYVWLQQAFLTFFNVWMAEQEIFQSIMDGNIAYELCRPVHIYDMWFFRSMANRLSRAVLRCFPILVVAAVLPWPYGIKAASGGNFVLFILTMVLALMITVAFTMLVYVLSFFTISPEGLRIVFVSVVEFLSGAIIPLPFFPQNMQRILEILPFASMQNVPLRIYGGNMSGVEIRDAVCLQVFWLFILVAGGRYLSHRAEKRATVQGG